MLRSLVYTFRQANAFDSKYLMSSIEQFICILLPCIASTVSRDVIDENESNGTTCIFHNVCHRKDQDRQAITPTSSTMKHFPPFSQYPSNFVEQVVPL